MQAAIDHQVEVMEIDVRQRPNGILVMAHDLVVKNSDGVPLADAFALLEPTAIRLNLDIKETKVLGALHVGGVQPVRSGDPHRAGGVEYERRKSLHLP